MWYSYVRMCILGQGIMLYHSKRSSPYRVTWGVDTPYLNTLLQVSYKRPSDWGRQPVSSMTEQNTPIIVNTWVGA